MLLGLDHGAPTFWRATAARAGARYRADGGDRRAQPAFSNDQAPVRALRDFGLSLVERAGPLKSAIIDHAAAWRRRLLKGIPL